MYDVHVCVHTCNFSPTETPYPHPILRSEVLKPGPLSQAQGLPGRAELPEPWDNLRPCWGEWEGDMKG